MNRKQWQKYNNQIISQGISSVNKTPFKAHQFVINRQKASRLFMTNFVRSLHKKNVVVDFDVKVENSQNSLPSGSQAIIDIKPFLHINICFIYKHNGFEYRQWFNNEAVINLSTHPPFHSQFDYLIKYGPLIKKRQKQLINGFCCSTARFVHRGHLYVSKVDH